MSAFLYGRLTAKREEATVGASTTDEPPAIKTYADAFVALVPAEVLAAAGVLVANYTDTTTDAQGQSTVVVTDAQNLKIAFYLLLLLGPVLYLLGHFNGLADLSKFHGRDLLRMAIPAGAFFGWTMAQRPATIFDAAIGWSDGTKILFVVFGGVLLGIVAARLGVAADQVNSPPAPAPPAPPDQPEPGPPPGA